MAAPFTQTTRGLKDDSFSLSLLLTPLLCLLLIGWAFWLFRTELTLYETSQNAYVRNAEIVVAEFPPSVLGTLNKDQAAIFVVDGFPRSEYGVLPATITLIRQRSGSQNVEVRLSINPTYNPSIQIQQGQAGVVEVATNKVTPAALFLRNLLPQAP